ncbi:chemotaxis response regulator protein-glutamate methylesterase [Poseidonocella sp. HB161398]|uniref:protein-glutamate methylesterase/protein-glutamine glutaminase n=1 Tax=Poseidonocella sp. HB161398 TaxID=2320855 RepID=UPI0011095AF6|nr:chemotaxis response regulator protein-glutamate methylesterase [Poseidonocella sp. HB161398]
MKDARGPIRVAIVDDSATIRRLVAMELARHPDLDLVGEAEHPYQARVMIKSLNPDVLVLDIEMPHMNGLDFLKKIMTLRPMPVLMFSSMTKRGAQAAVEALSTGAVDCLEKTPTLSTDGTLQRLPALIRMAAGARLAQPRTQDAGAGNSFLNRGRIVLIGSSTGGVDALEQVIGGFPANCPPTLITQHMPAEFLKSFSARLDNMAAPAVRLAADGEPLAEGKVLIAPGGPYHLALDGRSPRCVLDGQDKVSGHRPSVDVLFHSAVPVANRVVAAILTGMGADGARGMLALRRAGARTLAQDEESCTVFGMPRVALENGGAERAVPLRRVAPAILELCTQPGLQTV